MMFPQKKNELTVYSNTLWTFLKMWDQNENYIVTSSLKSEPTNK
jgi:hypothetical protein